MAYNTTSQNTPYTKLGSTPGSVSYITNVSISSGKVSTAGGSKQVTVTGDANAIFALDVTRTSNGDTYNFVTKLFSGTPTASSRLKNLKPGSYGVVFPSNSSGDTYNVTIRPEPHFNTELSFGKNKLRHQVKVQQLPVNSTITFATTAIGKSTATALGTSVGGSSAIVSNVVFVDKLLDFTSHADDFGVLITNPIPNSDFSGYWKSDQLYFEKTTDVVGAVTSEQNVVTLTSVANLSEGTELTFITGTTAPGAATTITNIIGNEVELSRNQALDDGATITFRSYGRKVIEKATGIALVVKVPNVVIEKASTTVRTALTSEASTLLVNGTKGFGVGSNVNGTSNALTGLMIGNSSSTTDSVISAVSGSVEQGTLTITNGEFKACAVGDTVSTTIGSNIVKLTGQIFVTKQPVANQALHLDMSRLLTALANG